MGEIADALRANLRELAQGDARLMRELSTHSATPAGAEAAPPAAALSDGLDKLGIKDLRELCKKKGHKGLTKFKKDELIALLRGGEPPAAPTPALRAATGSGSNQANLEARLERMEALLLRIAAHLGVE